MGSKYSVKLMTIAREMGLEQLNASKTYDSDLLRTAEVNRPAMQLTGFYSYFDPHRIQIIGRVESTYLDSISPEERYKSLETFLQYDVAGVVFCHGVEPFPEFMELARKYNRNVFITEEDTSSFIANIISSLNRHLAPRTSKHGVLVSVYGEGVLITGDSGIGKSETALELIKRGHRLIADDAVDIIRVDKDTLVGSAPEIIRYYMELRGIGVINARHIYGVGAVKPDANIDMVVHLEPWVEDKAYDRLGIVGESEEILGVTVPKVTVPVRPGRNLAVILELAALNNRQKKMGYNAAETLAASVDYAVDMQMQ